MVAARADGGRDRAARSAPGGASGAPSAPPIATATGRGCGRRRVGEIELAIPRKRSGPAYFPSFLEPRRRCEQAIVAVVMEAYVNGVSTRKVDRLVEQLGIHGMSKDRVSALCRQLDEQVEAFRNRPLEGAYPYLWLDAKHVKVRDRGARALQGAGDRLRGARDRPPRGDRHRHRRDRDRGLLGRVPALLRGRGLSGVRLVRLRRAPGPEGGDRPGARLPVAALHRALRPRHARPLPPRAARHGLRRPARDLQRPRPRRGARERFGEVHRAPQPDRRRRSPSCSRTPRRTCSPSTASPPRTGPSCARPTRSSASTARSAAAPTSSGSSPTTPPRSGSPARC